MTTQHINTHPVGAVLLDAANGYAPTPDELAALNVTESQRRAIENATGACLPLATSPHRSDRGTARNLAGACFDVIAPELDDSADQPEPDGNHTRAEMAATCDACHLPMLHAVGCTQPNAHAKPYGTETLPDDVTLPARCRDCGTTTGHHHHANCCIAQCSICGDQATYCGHAT